MRALLPPGAGSDDRSDDIHDVDDIDDIDDIDDMDDTALAAAYAYPDGLDRPHVRVNFVASADGAATVEGRSGGLGSPADKRVFGLLRELAEVVLVGAGTVRAENYAGARRPTRGRSAPPPVAVVTASADLDPGARLFTDTRVPPIVLTSSDAPADRRAELAAAGADVVLCDGAGGGVDLAAALAALEARGLRRVLCEGGPQLHNGLWTAGLADELCLTVAPLVAGGSARRITTGPGVGAGLALTHVLAEDDVLLLRYERL